MYPLQGGWVTETGTSIKLGGTEKTFHSKNGYARFQKEGMTGYANLKGKEIITAQYASASDFEGGIAIVKKENQWMGIDTTGKQLFTITCNYAYGFSNGLARFQLGNRFGFVNRTGEIVIPVKYYGAFDFSEGLARVYVDKKWGFIDALGKIVIAPTFDYVWNFSDGLASVMVKKEGKENWGYINTKGQFAIEPQYGYAFYFSEGYALVRKGDYKTGELILIDTSGTEVLRIDYIDAYPKNGGLVSVAKEIDGKQKWGCINNKGEVVFGFGSDNPIFFKNGLGLVKAEDEEYYIKNNGTLLIEYNLPDNPDEGLYITTPPE